MKYIVYGYSPLTPLRHSYLNFIKCSYFIKNFIKIYLQEESCTRLNETHEGNSNDALDQSDECSVAEV